MDEKGLIMNQQLKLKSGPVSVAERLPPPDAGLGQAEATNNLRLENSQVAVVTAPVNLRWPATKLSPQLGPAEVHVWAAQLDTPSLMVAEAWNLLAESERDQAVRFRFEVHRNRFIVGRGFLRAALGAYLEADPAKLEFSSGPAGKPFLGGSYENALLYFNLAHAEGLAVLAVTRLGPVGVDVEQVRRLTEFDALVNRFFSAAEASLFRELPEGEKPAAFFNLWTRKEAWLKATGEGITQLLDQVEVSFRKGEPARLVSVPQQFQFSEPWTLEDLRPAEGYAGALALAAAGQKLRCAQWQHPIAERRR